MNDHVEVRRDDLINIIDFAISPPMSLSGHACRDRLARKLYVLAVSDDQEAAA